MTLATAVSDPIAYGYYQFDAHQTRIALIPAWRNAEGAINQRDTADGLLRCRTALLPKAAEGQIYCAPWMPEREPRCVAFDRLSQC